MRVRNSHVEDQVGVLVNERRRDNCGRSVILLGSVEQCATLVIIQRSRSFCYVGVVDVTLVLGLILQIFGGSLIYKHVTGMLVRKIHGVYNERSAIKNGFRNAFRIL